MRNITVLFLFALLAMSCIVVHAQYDEDDMYDMDDDEFDSMAMDDPDDMDDSEFEVYGGDGGFQLPLAQQLTLPKQTYTAPARMEELPAIQNKPIYLPAQVTKSHSSHKKTREQPFQVRRTQTVLIRQPIIRTQRYKQPVIQPVVTQPVVTTRVVTQPVKQPVLTTKTVNQPLIYTQPIIVRRLQQQYQTNEAKQRTEYSTNPTITQQTQMLSTTPTENPAQYFNLPAQVQEEGGKKHHELQLPEVPTATIPEPLPEEGEAEPRMAAPTMPLRMGRAMRRAAAPMRMRTEPLRATPRAAFADRARART